MIPFIKQQQNWRYYHQWLPDKDILMAIADCKIDFHGDDFYPLEKKKLTCRAL